MRFSTSEKYFITHVIRKIVKICTWNGTTIPHCCPHPFALSKLSDRLEQANTHMARGISGLYHVFARKQCILCSTLGHRSYLCTYVTSLRDSFGLGSFARVYFATASQPRVSARLLVGNEEFRTSGIKILKKCQRKLECLIFDSIRAHIIKRTEYWRVSSGRALIA